MGSDLVRELNQKMKDLDNSLATLRKHGIDKAEKEHYYRLKKAEKMLHLRADKVPATIIVDIANGDPIVADARLKRDIAVVVYDANIDAINIIKKQITIIHDNIKMDFGSIKNLN